MAGLLSGVVCAKPLLDLRPGYGHPLHHLRAARGHNLTQVLLPKVLRHRTDAERDAKWQEDRKIGWHFNASETNF